jgi:hypothetical protein
MTFYLSQREREGPAPEAWEGEGLRRLKQRGVSSVVRKFAFGRAKSHNGVITEDGHLND